MGWTTYRNLSITIFAITAFILLFGNKFPGVTISSSGIMNTGITWLYIVAFAQIYLAVMFWKEYVGKDGRWYAEKPILFTLAIFSAFILFGFGSALGVQVFSSKIILGMTWTILFGSGQLLFLYWIINRNI